MNSWAPAKKDTRVMYLGSTTIVEAWPNVADLFLLPLLGARVASPGAAATAGGVLVMVLVGGLAASAGSASAVGHGRVGPLGARGGALYAVAVGVETRKSMLSLLSVFCLLLSPVVSAAPPPPASPSSTASSCIPAASSSPSSRPRGSWPCPPVALALAVGARSRP